MEIWQCDTKCNTADQNQNQLFSFILDTQSETGQFMSFLNQSVCIAVAGGGKANGTGLILWPCDKADANQRFRFPNAQPHANAHHRQRQQ